MTYVIEWSSQINNDTGTYAPGSIGKNTITVIDNSTDTSTTLTLTGRGWSNYGAQLQENFIRLMENFASVTAPINPTAGQMWFDTANEALKLYTISSTGSSPTFAWSQVYPAIVTSSMIDTALGYTPYNAANPSGYLSPSTLGTAVFGTANEINVASSGSGVTLSTPQAIGTTSTPTFSQLTISNPPINSTDTATKGYVDGIITGLSWKEAVAVATTANINLLGEQTIDGFTTSNSRVLVKNQTSAFENGIYVSNAGAWTRSTDADLASDFVGLAVYVQGGNTQASSGWVCTNTTAITLGTDPITFGQFSGSGAYIAGTGLSLSGNTFTNTGVTQIIPGTGISISPGGGTGNVTVSASGSVTSVSGTAGQIVASPTTGAVVLSLPSTVSVNISGNAATVGGYAPSLTPGAANTVVVRDGSGYINGSYFNSSDNVITTGVTNIMAKQGNNYFRSASAQAVASFISGSTMNINGSASSASTATTAYTAPTQPTSDSSSNIATTAFVHSFANPSNSLGGNGWTELPGGLIIQWGYAQATGGNNPEAVAVSFPRTFPNAVFMALCSTTKSTATLPAVDGSNFVVPGTLTTTGCSFVFDSINNAGYCGGYWMALGY